MPKAIVDESTIRENDDASSISTKPSDPLILFALVVLTILGGALRYFGCRSELWLDELISLHSAHALTSWTQVFTSIHMDNNHYFNTLYLYLIGEQANWATYRYFSLVCGTLSIPAAYWATATRSRNGGLFLAALVTFSYPLVYFSSEARGYAGAIIACFIALGAADRWLRTVDPRARNRWSVLYSATLIFGFLSHLTFVLITAELGLWILLATRERVSAVRDFVILHLFPVTAFALLAFLDFRGYFTLGGSHASAAAVLSRLLANSLGWTLRDSYSIWVFAIPLIAFGVLQLRSTTRQDMRPLFAILGGTLLAFVAFGSRFPFISQRYFLVFVPFLYLAVAIAFEHTRRLVQLAVLGLFVAGSLSLYFQFLNTGRGHYAEALRFIATKSSQPEQLISSDQDFRAGVELDFYQRTLPEPYTVRFIRHNTGGPTPDWLIVHDEAIAPSRPNVIRGTSAFGTKEAQFGTSELSGQAWTVYRLHSDSTELTK